MNLPLAATSVLLVLMATVLWRPLCHVCSYLPLGYFSPSVTIWVRAVAVVVAVLGLGAFALFWAFW